MGLSVKGKRYFSWRSSSLNPGPRPFGSKKPTPGILSSVDFLYKNVLRCAAILEEFGDLVDLFEKCASRHANVNPQLRFALVRFGSSLDHLFDQCLYGPAKIVRQCRCIVTQLSKIAGTPLRCSPTSYG